MKVTILGERFDTDKAQRHWGLLWLDDQSNRHAGDVYQSSKGRWYVLTPDEGSNRQRWLLMEPAAILGEYDQYLTQEAKEAIAEAAGLEWE
jgi:hypothetical protein